MRNNSQVIPESQADLGLHQLENTRACTPSGQLQSMSEHHLPALPQLIFYGGGRWVVSGPSQSLQLTGLSKSLLLTCQHQSRPNYKQRVYYSAHTKGTPGVPSLGDRGGCATGPYRTPTTLGHVTKRESWQLYLIHKNKHREAIKRSKESRPKGKNRSKLQKRN